MPDYSQIQLKLKSLEDANSQGGTKTVVYGSGQYIGFPSVLSDRLVTSMMGSGFEYEFSIVIPLYNLDGTYGEPVWLPKVDDKVTVESVDYRIAKVADYNTVETIIHLGKWLI